MKVFISVDIEGICDVVNLEHTNNSGFLYNSARKQMTLEANAAIAGAFEAGATEVVVNDSHGPMVNLMPELLDKRAELITGTTKPLSMMQNLDESFDAVMFVGYHARNNTPGVLSHTISGGTVDNIWINDRIVGESGFNAHTASHFNVPVVLVTGDQILKEEIRETLGEQVEFVQVKKAITRYSAQCLHPEVACEKIQAGAKNALSNLDKMKPLDIQGPFIGKIQFLNSGKADAAARLPHSKRVSGDTVSYEDESVFEVIKALNVMIALAR
jgi:D-amino peptidase